MHYHLNCGHKVCLDCLRQHIDELNPNDQINCGDCSSVHNVFQIKQNLAIVVQMEQSLKEKDQKMIENEKRIKEKDQKIKEKDQKIQEIFQQ